MQIPPEGAVLMCIEGGSAGRKIAIFNQNKTGIIGGVSLNTLKGLLLPLPPESELKRIIDKIDSLLEAIN